MSILTGDVSSNFRFNNVSGLLVPETITGETQTVSEFPEFTGYYGFNLTETPQTNVPGITSVTRVSDSQVFSHTTSSTIGTTEYFFDYSNDMPCLFFNAVNDGEQFTIAYQGVGAAVNGQNVLQLVANGIENNTSIFGKMKYASEYDKTFNANVTLLAGIAQLRSVVVTANMELYSNSTNTFGILEIFGNLTIDSGITLTLGRVLLIVHGNILGSGTILGKVGAAGGNGRSGTIFGGGGGGGGGSSLHIMCFGSIANTITIRSGRGGFGGLAGQTAATAGTAAFIDFGGTGGTATNAIQNGGGGGGGVGNGGNGAAAATPSTSGGTGAGGGGGGQTGNTAAGSGGASTIWISAGGNGGIGVVTPGNNGVNGGSGNLTLYSQYTSAPCTVDVSATTGTGVTGAAGSATYYNLAQLSHWLGDLTQTYSYLTKAGRTL